MTSRWLIVGTLVAALTMAIYLLHSPMTAVERIEVRGAAHTDVAAVLDDQGVGPGALLLWVDTAALRDAVAGQPWVSDVRVDKVWPRTIEIEVAEREAVVWVEGVLGWMLVARDGTVLERHPEPGPGHMQVAVLFPDWVIGELPDDAAWFEIVEMALVLADDIGSTLRLEMRGSELWTTAFDHDVRLGHPIDLADKGRVLRAMLGEEIPDAAVIDVSSPLRPAVVPVEAQLGIEAPGEQG